MITYFIQYVLNGCWVSLRDHEGKRIECVSLANARWIGANVADDRFGGVWKTGNWQIIDSNDKVYSI